MSIREADLVSVVVPCFNQARFLSEAFRSLQAQTHKHWECIIVNDGSTDDTERIARALVATDARVRVINQSNLGLSGARNRGLAETSGSYVQFLDADDLLESRKLEHQVDFLARHPEIGIAYGEARYFTTENPDLRCFSLIGDDVVWKEAQPWIGPLWSSGRTLPEILLERNIMAVNCALVRRKVFEVAGLWDERMKSLEDWEFWARCVFFGIQFQYFEAPNGFALVRSHPGSMSRDRTRMNRAAIRLRIRLAQGLTDPVSKLRNFEVGLSLLSDFCERDEFVQGLFLAWANRCKMVFRRYVAFSLRRHPRALRLVQFLRGLATLSLIRGAFH